MPPAPPARRRVRLRLRYRYLVTSADTHASCVLLFYITRAKSKTNFLSHFKIMIIIHSGILNLKADLHKNSRILFQETLISTNYMKRQAKPAFQCFQMADTFYRL